MSSLQPNLKIWLLQPTSTDLPYTFCDVTKFRNAGLPMERSRRFKRIFKNKRNCGLLLQVLRQVVLISSIKPISSNISLLPLEVNLTCLN